MAQVRIRGTLLDWDDPQTTVQNIMAHPINFRWSLVLDLIMSSCDVVISILLGGILLVSGAHPLTSIVAMVFRLLQQAVLATNLIHLFAASLLLDDTLPVATVITNLFGDSSNSNSSSGSNRAQSLAFLFLLLHKYGYLLALEFFGLSMSILGYVIWIWGVFPKWMGGLLFLAGLAYVVDSTLYFVQSGYNGQVSPILMIPVFLAEFGFACCLLLQKQTLAHHRL